MLIGENGLVQAAGALNVPLGGLILAASALPSLRRPRSAATVLRIQVATLVALVLIGTAGLVVDGLIPAIPRYESVFAQLDLRRRRRRCSPCWPTAPRARTC